MTIKEQKPEFDASLAGPAGILKPPLQRAAIVLRYYADLPDAAIADAELLVSTVPNTLLERGQRVLAQRLADQVSGWFVPAVILFAIAAFVAWAMFGPEPRYAYGLVAAVTVLIIACPCAMGLAVPTAVI